MYTHEIVLVTSKNKKKLTKHFYLFFLSLTSHDTNSHKHILLFRFFVKARTKRERNVLWMYIYIYVYRNEQKKRFNTLAFGLNFHKKIAHLPFFFHLLSFFKLVCILYF